MLSITYEILIYQIFKQLLLSTAHNEDDLLTTTRPQINATTGMPTSTMIPHGSLTCVHNGDIYADGASIQTEDPCEHCYCMKGDLVCAVTECKSSLDEDSEGCVPRPPLPGQCCPESYVCRKCNLFTNI